MAHRKDLKVTSTKTSCHSSQTWFQKPLELKRKGAFSALLLDTCVESIINPQAYRPIHYHMVDSK